MATPDLKSSELKLDLDKLYLEEVFTDRRIGTIRRLTPVAKDGKPDASRTVLYVGETQIMTPAGSIPIAFEIGADSRGEAAEKFGSLAKDAIDRTVRELQELRRQASSSIVVPQGPLGAGGKIQLPWEGFSGADRAGGRAPARARARRGFPRAASPAANIP